MRKQTRAPFVEYREGRSIFRVNGNDMRTDTTPVFAGEAARQFWVYYDELIALAEQKDRPVTVTQEKVVHALPGTPQQFGWKNSEEAEAFNSL
jgi:hypothetical protein